MRIRLYQRGDIPKICQLIDDNTQYKRNKEFWVWLNRLLSTKNPIIAVAEKNDSIIGHYAIIPRDCWIGEKSFSCGLGVHAFVHPDYRTQVSITSISAYAYKQAKFQGVDFIYGFPNANYRLIQEKIERWSRVAIFNAFEKTSSAVAHKPELYFIWEKVDKNCFNQYSELAEVLDDNKSTSKIRLDNSLVYFVNRFILHPQNLYTVWLLRDKNKRAETVVVVKKFTADGVRRVHIVDYVISKENFLELMLADFEQKFCDSDAFVHWAKDDLFRSLLVKNGYEASGFETFFGIKFLSDKAKQFKNELLVFNNWELSMGDSDAF